MRLSASDVKKLRMLFANTDTEVASILAKVTTDLPGLITTLDGVADAIKAVTDAMPEAGAFTTIDGNIDALVTAVSTIDGLVDAIKAVTDALPEAGALTTIDGLLDSIKAVTDLLPDAGALSSLSTAAAVATIDGIIDNLLILLTQTVSKGVADVDISAADYVADYVTLLTITPAVGKPVEDLQIDLAYNKAATGISVVATAADTLDVAVFAMADDAVESMIMITTQKVLSGNASPVVSGERLKVGTIDGAITVKVKLSAERADAEIPYKVSYKALEAPTITPVAAV